MSRQHGVTVESYRRMVIDAGAVYKNYGETGELLLGATRGGNTFTIETEYREMPVDGAKGPVKGSRRITRVNAKIVANFVEFTETILGLALPGSASAVDGDYTVITRALTLALSDYNTNIAIVGEVAGSNDPVVCIIENVIADGNLEIALADNEEAVAAVTFTAHFDPDALDAEPWEIRWPDVTTED